MRKIISLLATYFLFIISVNAQKDSHNNERIKDSRIYFLLNNNEIEYFTHSKTKDGKSKIKDNQKFSLDNGNHCNIYMKWLNPLKYNITWKDSISIDDRDKAIKDFIDLLTAQFGSSVTSLGKTNSRENLYNSKPKALKANETSLQGLDKGFNSLDLTSLFIQLNLSIGNLTEDERKKINELIPLLVILDDKNNKNISDELDKLFIELFNETDPKEATSKIDKCKSKNNEYNAYFKDDIEANRELVLNKLKEIKISNALLNSLLNLSINKFLNDVNSNLAKNKELVSKLNPIINIIDKSLVDQSDNPLTVSYYQIKYISFDDGKKFETTISISQYKYDSTKKEFLKENDITSKKMIFEKYDIFDISVSAGIFYGNTNLKSYGVANNGTNFTVAEDNIDKNNAVTALFLNFNFKTSRYFSPLIQLGIDPTKKRPFLLVGAGFSIPSASIAFSGGPIWTWNQTLDKLSVGEIVNSTTDLEKDIKYEFDVEPKGWYLGIQYNF